MHVHFAVMTEEVEILRLPSSGSLRMTRRGVSDWGKRGSTKPALGGDGFRGGRNYQAGAGEELIGFHPEGENGANKEQDYAADKR